MLPVAVVVSVIVGGVLGAIALWRTGKDKGPQPTHPTATEFKAFVEERAKAFLSTQDLDSLVQLVPEDRRAEFSTKLLGFLQAVVETSAATTVSVLLKIEDVEKLQGSVLEKSTETLAKSTETLNRLDRVRETITAITDLSEKLARNMRISEQIYNMSRQIRMNLAHAGLMTTFLLISGAVTGLIVSILAARPPFAGVSTPRLLESLGLAIVITMIYSNRLCHGIASFGGRLKRPVRMFDCRLRAVGQVGIIGYAIWRYANWRN